MKRVFMLTSLAFTFLGGAQAASLAEQLPAGALMTLETHQAQGATRRVLGLMGQVLKQSGLSDVDKTLGQVEKVVKGSLSQEAALGVFSVSTPGRTFQPHLLGVTRADNSAQAIFGEQLGAKAGARVGAYSFRRQGGMYVGMAGGLMYFSTNKDLLMAYLGRLSGKRAPLLQASAAYSVPKRALGQREVSLYANFSGLANVLRAQLQRVGAPRLLSPIVDALDTLGQYAAGLNTTAAGLESVSAHAANPQGKDQPLYHILTHTTTFAAQNIIPASAEAVVVSACHPDSGAYLGRWLTRLDLADPTGFLTDSQLAWHLERAGRYLDDECAQVTLPGSLKAGLNSQAPLASLNYSVFYQRVRDMDAAKQAMPEYIQSVNKALSGAAGSLGSFSRQWALSSSPLGNGASKQATQQTIKQLHDLAAQLKGVQMVYAFRGEYLLTALSDQALRAALDEAAPTLAQSAGFQAAQLPTSGAGWSYRPKLPALTGQELLGALDAQEREQFLKPGAAANLTVMDAMADVLNRYDGATAQRWVQGNLILSKSQVAYRW